MTQALAAFAPILMYSQAWGDGWKFDFSNKPPDAGFTPVAQNAMYDETRGFGFVHTSPPGDGAPNGPSIFAVSVDEGNYDVTVRFGHPQRATSTTIKAESRRLLVEEISTAADQSTTRSFTVNVRKPAISTGGVTSLNDREKGPPMVPDWDDQLTFEFNGRSPGVAQLEIQPSKEAITVFVAGDSTVTNQAKEPYAGWAQMLPRFFGQGVAISNHAESGLALFSFEKQKRLEKVLSMMKPGDYFFIQFGHNDQKDKRPDAGPFTTYKSQLQEYAVAARKKGGIPVVITPMERRRFDENGTQQATLTEYAEAVRQIGAEMDVPVIDLNEMSLKLYAALGPENSTKAFAHYPADTFPGQDKPLKDDTHHNTYGAYELARCVVEGIRTRVPELGKHVRPDIGSFDPASPDPLDAVAIPASPFTGTTEKPAGN